MTDKLTTHGHAILPATVAPCAACRTTRGLDDLLGVTDTRSGRSFWVCRPDADGRCFRARVAGAQIHSIGRTTHAREAKPHP